MTRLLDARPVAAACQLVSDEQDQIAELLSAYDTFGSGVSQLSVDSPPAAGSRSPTGGGLESMSSTVRNEPSDDRIQQVRELFADTVRSHSTDQVDESEPLVVTIREELGDELALALSPSTNTVFTVDLKRAVLSSVDQCRAELKAMETGLAVETESLRTACSVRESITDWLTADHPPLSTLDFEQLRQRHEQLAAHRRRCEQLAADRQSTLHETTNHAVSAEISHWTLVAYLYQPLSTANPVLSLVAHLIDLCVDCQRTVRNHLVRRV